MKKITIENTQKDAKWASKEVNVPESALECFDVYGTNDGMYTMAMSTSFPVRFRKTDGSQEAADNLFKGIFGRTEELTEEENTLVGNLIEAVGVDRSQALAMVKAKRKADKKSK